MPATYLLPSNSRLLQSVRSTLGEILASEMISEAGKLRLSAADEALNELLLRSDSVYLSEYYTQCVAMIEEGRQRLQTLSTDDPVWKAASSLPQPTGDRITFEEASPLIVEAWSCLSSIVTIARREGDPDSIGYVEKIIGLEHAFHEHRRTASMTPEALVAPRRADVSGQAFEMYIQQRYPDRGARVTQFRELVGGFQKTTVLITLAFADGSEENLVMRLEKDHEKYVILDAGNVEVEFDIVRFVHEHGVASAEPKWLETDSAAMGAAFMLTSHVQGSSIKVTGVDPSLLPPAERLTEKALKSVVETLAAVHALPLDGLAETPVGHGMRHGSLASNTAAIVESWASQRWSRDMMTSPTATLAFDWLRSNVPQDEDRLSLVHVDYGLHNILIDNEQVSAVLDWESARIGDPAEDLAYLLQSLGPAARREQIIEWYEAASGRHISEARLRYFDVYNTLKVLLAGCHSAALFEHEPRAGMEWCSLALFIFLYGAGPLLEKIAIADAAKHGGT